MIQFPSKDELIVGGRLLKPHGIKGEIAVGPDIDGLDLAQLRCLIVEMDGIPVPFFPSSVRPKNHSSVLVTFDGISDENEAAELCNKDFYVLPEDVPEGYLDGEDEEGFYAYDLIDFEADDASGRKLGKIADVEDSTENVLFIIETPAGDTLYVPVADEFIQEIDIENKHIVLDPPLGIDDLNS